MQNTACSININRIAVNCSAPPGCRWVLVGSRCLIILYKHKQYGNRNQRKHSGFEGHPRNRTRGLKHPQIATGESSAKLSRGVHRSQHRPGEEMEKGEAAAACHVRGDTVMAALPLAALTLATCTHRYFVGVDYLIHPPPPSFHHVNLIVTVTIVNWFCNFSFQTLLKWEQPTLSFTSIFFSIRSRLPSLNFLFFWKRE